MEFVEKLENIIENTTKRRSSSSGSLPPPLQELIDKEEAERVLYEDSWGKTYVQGREADSQNDSSPRRAQWGEFNGRNDRANVSLVCYRPAVIDVDESPETKKAPKKPLPVKKPTQPESNEKKS